MDYMNQWTPLASRDNAYAAYGGARSLPDSKPPFGIERLEIGHILITLDDERVAASEGPLPPVSLFEMEVSNLAFPASLRTDDMTLSVRGQWDNDPDAGFQLSVTSSTSEAVSVSTIRFSVKRLDLSQWTQFYATTLPVDVESGLVSMSGSVRVEGGTVSGEVSFLLENLAIQAVPGKPLFGLPVETSARVIEGINRYAEEVPLVFGSAVGGTTAAPTLQWEAQLLEVAREGLMMAGRRELDRTIESLAERIEFLGGLEDIPLDASFQVVGEQADAAARAIVEQAAGGLIHDMPGLGERIDDSAGRDDAEPGASRLLDVLPGLLEDLLEPSSQDSGTDEEQTPTSD
jgi:hypothetical protein